MCVYILDSSRILWAEPRCLGRTNLRDKWRHLVGSWSRYRSSTRLRRTGRPRPPSLSSRQSHRQSTTTIRCTTRCKSLTPWRPLLSYEASCARPGAVICNFWHPGTLTLSRERQSGRMSKITNDGLTPSGTRCFIAVYAYDNSGRHQRVWSEKLSGHLSL